MSILDANIVQILDEFPMHATTLLQKPIAKESATLIEELWGCYLAFLSLQLHAWAVIESLAYMITVLGVFIGGYLLKSPIEVSVLLALAVAVLAVLYRLMFVRNNVAVANGVISLEFMEN
jgi:hypothetical protein